MNRQLPFISVIVPAYNEAKSLPDCLTSLRNQTYAPHRFEIIVVDNGSKDTTPQVAKKYTSKVFTYTDFQGCAATRRYGVKQAKGDLFVFIDADTSVGKDCLEKIASRFEDSKLMCLGGKVLSKKKSFWLAGIFEFAHIFFLMNNFFHKPLLWGAIMAIRKKAYIGVGGFDHSLTSADDWELALRLQKTYGRKSVKYMRDIVGYTEERKFDKRNVFLRYAWDSTLNYINVIILNKKKVNGVFNVR
jgi:glycosyltransferase involved in cell wall biosynthesis